MTNFKAINEWEVLTPSGWSGFAGINKIQKLSYVTIKFTDKTSISCSSNHRFKQLNNDFIYANKVKRGTMLLGKDECHKKVESKRTIYKKIDLYDLNNVNNDQEFYSDDIISHNCALIENAEELWTSALPTLSTGGRAILLSTPRGLGNFFHKMWVGAEEGNTGKIGKNGFHAIRLPWDLHPERNSEWRRIEGEKIGNPKEASQEYDCDFLASGDNVINLQILEFYKKNKIKDPIAIRGADHGLWIWEYPDYNHSYLLSADCARGDGADFSAAHVIDITNETPTQVAEYKGTYGTKDFGNFLVSLGTEYNSAMLIVERENIGWAVLQQIIEREYKNLFYSSADLKYVDVQRQLSNKIDSDEKKMVPGFSTNMKTRPLIISNLEQYFREMAIDILSKRTIAELETFIWKNGKAQAMDGYNDDLVMSLCIGLWIRDTALRLRQEGIDLMKAGLGKMSMNKLDTTPVYKTNNMIKGENTWKMNTGRQGFGNANQEDIRWLIG